MRGYDPVNPDDLPAGGCAGVDPGGDGSLGYTWGPGKGARWRFDKHTDVELWDIFMAVRCKAIAAALEKVGAMPKQGVSSTFKFGRGLGLVEGWLVAAGYRWDWVTPGKWQTALRCRTGGDKKITQAKAQQLWPDIKFTQKDAEGLLIAEWCRLHADWAK